MKVITDFIKKFINTAENYEMQLISYQEKETSKRKMKKKINSLENKVEFLENIIKEELYKEFMDKIGEPEKIKRLTKENKQLKIKNKLLNKKLIESEV